MPDEYARAAQMRGLAGLIVTCHNPMPKGFSSHVRMSIDEFPEYLDIVDRARRQFLGVVDVRLGLEADYFPGYEDWLEQQLSMNRFDYVLGSVHPQLPEFRERYWVNDPVEFQRTYFSLLADAAETNLFDCLAHPDLVKNVTADFWEPDSIRDEIGEALDRIAATGIAMELNTSGKNKRVPEMNPGPEILREIRSRGIPVVVGADAHEPGRVADGYLEAFDLLETCGFGEIHFFLNRERQSVTIADARQSLIDAGRSLAL
jgi:histidinol-phosphatase (PHP family)